MAKTYRTKAVVIQMLADQASALSDGLWETDETIRKEIGWEGQITNEAEVIGHFVALAAAASNIARSMLVRMAIEHDRQALETRLRAQIASEEKTRDTQG